MRKILSNCPVSCFADEISVSLDRQIQVLNELGIKFVEFRSADGTGVADFTDEQAKEAKKRLDAAGIRVSAVGSPIGKSYWGSGHTACIGDFYKALENNTDFALELPVLENSIRLMLGAYESAREHHVVEFS